MDPKMISRCGLECTGCPAFQATRAKDEAKARETAALWSKLYNVKVEVKDVWCNGCLGRGKHCTHWGECEIRACAQKKRAKNCAFCKDYPCDPLEGFFQMAPEARQRLDGLRGGR